MANKVSNPRGLAFKLSLSILSATAIIIFGILFYNYHFSKRLLLESARETAKQITNATLHQMESILISAQRVPQSEVLFLQYPELKQEAIEELLGIVLQNKPEIFGTAIAFAPFAFNKDKEGYAPYYFRQGDDYHFKDLADDNYDYLTSGWFIEARDHGSPVWTEPYFDIGGGNILMATYAIPFYSDSNSGKKFRGVATADLSLEWLEGMLDSIKVFQTGYVFLLSDRGTVISHPLKEFQMHNLEDLAKKLNNKSMIKLTGQILDRDEGYFPFKSLVDQRPCWMYYSTLPQTQWHMAVVFPEAELLAGLKNLYLSTIFIGILGVILLSIIVITFSSRITKPLTKLTLTADVIGSGNFDVLITEDRSTKEMAMLGNAFSRMQAELKDYMKNLESTTAAKERFESELNIAHDIQQGMIPKIFPPFPGRKDIDIYALLEPARQVGGDFYDFFLLNDDTLCFSIGDVSDKGVPAALLMSMTITLFRAKSDIRHEISELVNSINRDVSKDNVNMMFVTFFMGILDLKSGKMKFCNAGHNYPVILKKNGDFKWLDETHGVPLGVSESFKYKSGEIEIGKGDVMIIYTDGINEAMSIDGDFYGDDRLAAVIGNKCRGLDPKQTAETIMKDVTSFTRNPERSDDITLMVLSYYPEI
jgi:sigma-B regulation protein RsbU (phosphoserine phosphatase)